jgi:hypothetical protein
MEVLKFDIERPRNPLCWPDKHNRPAMRGLLRNLEMVLFRKCADALYVAYIRTMIVCEFLARQMLPGPRQQ